MSKRGTQQAGASNSTVSGGESDPTASNRHGRDRRWWARLAGHRRRTATTGKGTRVACQKLQGKLEKRSAYKIPERFPLFHPGRDFRGWNLVVIL